MGSKYEQVVAQKVGGNLQRAEHRENVPEQDTWQVWDGAGAAVTGGQSGGGCSGSGVSAGARSGSPHRLFSV